jgi:hypothetical protein
MTMSKPLLKAYIRLAVKEAHLARVPNQLVSDGGHEGEENDEADVNEFCGAGGGGNTLGSGEVMGFSGPLGAGSSKKKKRTKKTT